MGDPRQWLCRQRDRTGGTIGRASARGWRPDLRRCTRPPADVAFITVSDLTADIVGPDDVSFDATFFGYRYAAELVTPFVDRLDDDNTLAPPVLAGPETVAPAGVQQHRLGHSISSTRRQVAPVAEWFLGAAACRRLPLSWCGPPCASWCGCSLARTSHDPFRTTPQAPQAPAAAPVVLRHDVEWYAGGSWSASVRTWPTRREAAEEAGRVGACLRPRGARRAVGRVSRAGRPGWARRSPMLIDLVNAAHPALLVAGTAAYVAALLWGDGP